MSERIIVIVETIAVVILAIVVVIYAQVLWQRFQLASQEQPQAEAPTATSDDADGNDITNEERLEVLRSISETTTNSVTPDERSRVLEALSEDQASIEVDTETRMQVLESLGGN